jgi:hypothetical protein
MMAADAISKLPPFYGQSTLVNIVIDTPKGAQYKPKYEPEAGIFRVL